MPGQIYLTDLFRPGIRLVCNCGTELDAVSGSTSGESGADIFCDGVRGTASAEYRRPGCEITVAVAVYA